MHGATAGPMIGKPDFTAQGAGTVSHHLESDTGPWFTIAPGKTAPVVLNPQVDGVPRRRDREA